MSIEQLRQANRQAELLMKKHTKMQTGFEKVIFAILQNCKILINKYRLFKFNLDNL